MARQYTEQGRPEVLEKQNCQANPPDCYRLVKSQLSSQMPIFIRMNMLYNIFMETNITIPELSEQIAGLLQAVGSPARVAILIAIGRGEACVCHLEAILGWRQAYLSQHLMALRKAGLLQDRRAGRFIYYKLKDEAILALVREAALLSGLSAETVDSLANPDPGPDCECPTCVPTLISLDQIKGP
jgi:ArsR family transcriptional regulator